MREEWRKNDGNDSNHYEWHELREPVMSESNGLHYCSIRLFSLAVWSNPQSTLPPQKLFEDRLDCDKDAREIGECRS